MNGYAHRSHEILSAQQASKDIEVHALTSPWYPERKTLDNTLELDGITYHRCLHPALTPPSGGVFKRLAARRGRKKREKYNSNIRGVWIFKAMLEPFALLTEEKIIIKHFVERIIDLAQEIQPDIIHAHTPYRVGAPALIAARKLGIPFVYEMRGAWEETAVANGRWKSGGLAHRRFKRKETEVLRAADAVVCIGNSLKENAVSRGINKDKITVVPNGASEETMLNPIQDEQIAAHRKKLHSMDGKSTVGYIGSIQALEGLEYLVDALAILKEKGELHRLLIVSASDKTELIDYIETKGLSSQAMVIGPIDRDKISNYYSMIDIFCVPRPRIRVAELVTPLKPMESMMAGCATVVSDLPALKELVSDGDTGRIFEAENSLHLSQIINELSEDNEKREELGVNAKEWIQENRLWPSIVKRYIPIYESLKKP
jgi:glycosyltransferase involved in cell wall biosynthesis